VDFESSSRSDAKARQIPRTGRKGTASKAWSLCLCDRGWLVFPFGSSAAGGNRGAPPRRGCGAARAQCLERCVGRGAGGVCRRGSPLLAERYASGLVGPASRTEGGGPEVGSCQSRSTRSRSRVLALPAACTGSFPARGGRTETRRRVSSRADSVSENGNLPVLFARPAANPNVAARQS